MATPMDLIMATIQRKGQERKANALNDIFAKSYEPGAAIPFVDDAAQAMGLPQEPGMIAGNQPGRINVQNALAQMAQSKEPGFAMKAFELQQQMDKQELEKQKAIRSSDSPMSVQETQWFMQQPPEIRSQHLALKRAQQLMNLGGTQAVLDPTTGQISQSYQVTPKPDQMPAFQGAQESAKLTAKGQAEKLLNKPKIESGISSTGTKKEMLGGLIEKAKSQAGFFTTGFVGGLSKGLGGTPAHDLQNTLSTIKSNLGFDKLQEMKNSSPSGSALGAVSDTETKLLQSTFGALEQSQTKEQFIENLDLVKKQTEESWARVREAYQKDYGVPYTGNEYAGVTEVTKQGAPQKPKNTEYKVNGLTKGPDGRMYLIRSLKSDGTPDEVIAAQ